MITLSDYLKKMLFEQDCVVLPELGGFLSHFNHSFFSATNQTYFPPTKRIAFNEALKLDDGLLTHFISLNEEISREEAAQKVREFINEIKKEINQNGHFEISGLGKLVTTNENKIQFEPDEQANFYEEGYGLKAFSAQEISEDTTVSSPYAPDWQTTDREPVLLAKKSNVGLRRAMYVGGALMAGILVYGSLGTENNYNFRSSLNPFELFAGSNETIAEKPIVATTPARPIVVPPVVEAIAPPAVAETKPASLPINTTPVEKLSIKKDVIKAVEMEIKGIGSDEDASYFIIAGAFSKQENAEKLQHKLIKNGFVGASVMNIDERNLIKVSAVGFNSQQKAIKYLKKVGNLSDATAWVHHVE